MRGLSSLPGGQWSGNLRGHGFSKRVVKWLSDRPAWADKESGRRATEWRTKKRSFRALEVEH
jgi:hypothetical protein